MSSSCKRIDDRKIIANDLSSGGCQRGSREERAEPQSSARETSSATAAWSAAVGLRTRLIHVQGTSAHFFPIQSSDCLGRFVVIGHFNETEATSLARVPVRDNIDTRKLTKRLEDRTQFAFRSLETHIADKHILHPVSPFFPTCRNANGARSVKTEMLVGSPPGHPPGWRHPARPASKPPKRRVD